jgi:meso-butanediol dehydrogenase / (S,S)-butanediol dehydrogenase / diacetyl reductase
MTTYERLKGTSAEAPERALMTGATSGIGRAIALRLAQRGAVVGLIGRNESAAQALQQEIEAMAGRSMILLADVSKSDEMAKTVSLFTQQFKGIETVVACAGIGTVGNVLDTSVADWDKTIAVNLSAVFYLAKYAVPELIKTRGTFTIISSDSGLWGACDLSAYVASKHGVQGLMKSMALDFGRYGVRTNTVCPGFVETPMAESVLAHLSSEELAAFKKTYPLGEFTTPEEVAEVVAHLTSDQARHVNALEYRVDSGKTAGHYRPFTSQG